MNGKHHKLDDLFKAMIMQDEEEASRLVISAFNGYIYFIVDLDVKLATQLYSLHIINDDTIYEGFCTYVTYTMVMNTLLETYPWMDPAELESRKKAFGTYSSYRDSTYKVFTDPEYGGIIYKDLSEMMGQMDITMQDVKEYLDLINKDAVKAALHPLTSITKEYYDKVDEYVKKFYDGVLTNDSIDDLKKQYDMVRAIADFNDENHVIEEE